MFRGDRLVGDASSLAGGVLHDLNRIVSGRLRSASAAVCKNLFEAGRTLFRAEVDRTTRSIALESLRIDDGGGLFRTKLQGCLHDSLRAIGFQDARSRGAGGFELMINRATMEISSGFRIATGATTGINNIFRRGGKIIAQAMTRIICIHGVDSVFRGAYGCNRGLRISPCCAGSGDGFRSFTSSLVHSL